MKKWMSFVLALASVMLLAVPVLAADTRVFDEAELFESSQVTALENRIDTMRGDTGFDIVILTVDDAKGKTPQQTADDFYDEGGFGKGSDYTGILFLIDMDNREPYISTSGAAIRFFTDTRIDTMIDEVFEYLYDEDWYGAAGNFLDNVSHYHKQGISGGQYNYDTETGKVSKYRSYTLTDALVAAFAGLAVGGTVFLVVVMRYRVKLGQYKYPHRQYGQMRVRDAQDVFVNQTVHTQRIQSSSSGGGGGSSSSGGGSRSSTHTSSSGRTHGGGGGGGRKF